MMAKGKPNIQWKKLVLEWQTSGKTTKNWCKENNIPLTTFLGWKSRLKKQELNNPSNALKTGFIELKDSELSESGISLEIDGIKIHLNIQFDSRALKQCLNCLRST
jgi:hypothetical protein